jgi:proliferating cell nuclear antigen
MMVSIQLHAVAFENYKCSRPLALGISVPNLSKVLSIARNGDAMYVRAKHDDDDISFVFESKDRKFEFNFRLVHLTGELLEIPDNLEFIRTVEMSSAEFRKSIMDLFEVGSDNINIDVMKNELIFTATNKDMGTARLTFPTPSAEEDVQKVYRSKLLTVVTKGIAFSKTVVLNVGGEDIPIKISFPMGEKGCVSYYLAEVIPSE